MQKKMYRLIELRSGVKGICRYDKVMALEIVHNLNKIFLKERWAICAV